MYVYLCIWLRPFNFSVVLFTLYNSNLSELTKYRILTASTVHWVLKVEHASLGRVQVYVQVCFLFKC